jgi:hypothetical protein
MNMLSMRRTSNLKSFEIAAPQGIKESVQTQEKNSPKQNNQPEQRMSIEMEDDKDTSVKKK